MDKPDQIFPLFVMQVMGDIPCLPGLFVAGVFSGALSTVSSGLNALAAVTFQDFIQGGCAVQMEEKRKTIVCTPSACKTKKQIYLSTGPQNQSLKQAQNRSETTKKRYLEGLSNHTSKNMPKQSRGANLSK